MFGERLIYTCLVPTLALLSVVSGSPTPEQQGKPGKRISIYISDLLADSQRETRIVIPGLEQAGLAAYVKSAVAFQEPFGLNGMLSFLIYMICGKST